MDQNSSNRTQSSAQPTKSTSSTSEFERSNPETRSTQSFSKPTLKPVNRAPGRDDIEVRAYQIYVSRNREPGHEVDDWLQAERELLPRN